MGWSASEFFTKVCRISTRNCKSYMERVSVLIALIDAFEAEDFDTPEECFDDVPDLETAFYLLHPSPRGENEG